MLELKSVDQFVQLSKSTDLVVIFSYLDCMPRAKICQVKNREDWNV